ncbi:MAG TPA: hypothetical protein VH143_30490 [Kofleriaceae bacterium]|nr:hypothetical protein [Kofleriaceae bacterium]
MKRIAWVAILIGCAGKAPPQPATSADGGTGGDDADAPLGSDATELAVSGNVTDYFTGNLLDTTIVQSDGLDPAVNTTDAADGSYNLQVATGSKLYLVATRANYLTTRNPVTSVSGSDVIQNVFVLSESDVKRQYSSVGSAENGAAGYVEVELEKNDGTPLTGIATTAVVLTDESGSAVPVSTYFAGAVGDLDLTVTTSTAEGSNGARAGLLNVPDGQYSLAVTYTNGMGLPNTNYTPVVVNEGAATLVISGGVGQPSTAPPPTQPSFATDIYPRLQTAAHGGLGCANCHTATGPAGANALPYDGASAATFTLVTTTAGVVVIATPATSLFLTMPLYETTPPQNHPNATFLDVNDPDYKLFLAWITAGAKP